MSNSLDVNRRQLLAGAGVGTAALMLQQSGVQAASERPVQAA